MQLKNVEIKSECSDPNRIRSILQRLGADYQGRDHQIDTYFEISEGRLKLREGSIEQNLIYYRRADKRAPKRSDIELVPVSPDQAPGLKSILATTLGIRVIVEKTREIYWIDNVKFHIDKVQKLGSFVEIEAIDDDGSQSSEALQQQCRHYLGLLEIDERDLVDVSYCDLIEQLH